MNLLVISLSPLFLTLCPALVVKHIITNPQDLCSFVKYSHIRNNISVSFTMCPRIVQGIESRMMIDSPPD